MFIFSDYKYKGTEQLWILGDKFVADSVWTHFMNKSMHKEYTHSNFEVHVMTGNVAADAHMHSPVVRFHNVMVHMMQKHQTLPKWIIIIPEG